MSKIYLWMSIQIISSTGYKNSIYNLVEFKAANQIEGREEYKIRITQCCFINTFASLKEKMYLQFYLEFLYNNLKNKNFPNFFCLDCHKKTYV